MLTWASLYLIGGGEKAQDEARAAHEATFKAADKQISEWGIKHNDQGERADAYLYCVEVKPEGCEYGKGATVVNGRVVDPFNGNRFWSIEAIRGSLGLRRWSNEDLTPRPDDIFQNRL